MTSEDFKAPPVGYVRSALTRRVHAPRQGSEGAPDAWIEIDPRYLDALGSIAPGDELILLTWLHLADRDVLTVHPRNDPAAALEGVFATRSADRPNPIGLHPVTVRERAGARLRVGPVEVVDGTPVLDVKSLSSGPEGPGARPRVSAVD